MKKVDLYDTAGSTRW